MKKHFPFILLRLTDKGYRQNLVKTSFKTHSGPLLAHVFDVGRQWAAVGRLPMSAVMLVFSVIRVAIDTEAINNGFPSLTLSPA